MWAIRSQLHITSFQRMIFCLRLYFTKLGEFKLIDANINDNRHNANTISLNCMQFWLNVMQANTIYRYWMKSIEWLLNLHVVLLLLIYWKIGDEQIFICTKFHSNLLIILVPVFFSKWILAQLNKFNRMVAMWTGMHLVVCGWFWCVNKRSDRKKYLFLIDLARFL